MMITTTVVQAALAPPVLAQEAFAADKSHRFQYKARFNACFFLWLDPALQPTHGRGVAGTPAEGVAAYFPYRAVRTARRRADRTAR